ncbi:hypothetical protein Tco_0139071 [Tanacetum coccineum]
MSIGRLCIATKQKQLIDEEVFVLINGDNFIVHVRELSNRSVKIEDDLESEDGISERANTPQASTGFNVYFHEKLKFIKYRLKIWNYELKNEVNRKKEAIDLLQDIDHKIDSSIALDSEKETRLQLLYEIHNIDHMESMDLFQKARIK